MKRTFLEDSESLALFYGGLSDYLTVVWFIALLHGGFIAIFDNGSLHCSTMSCLNCTVSLVQFQAINSIFRFCFLFHCDSKNRELFWFCQKVNYLCKR
jgi:hypothetical protein